MKKFFCFILLGVLFASCNNSEPDPALSIDGKTTYSLDNKAADIDIKIVTNCSSWAYDLGEAASWIDVKSSSGELLSLSVSENATAQTRRAVVAISAPKSGANQATANVVISQDPLIPVLGLDCSLTLSVPAKDAKKDITVTTNMGSWNCSTDDAWIIPTKSGDKLTLTFADNPEDAARAGKLKVYAPDSASPMTSKTISVTQEPADIDYPKEDLSVSATSNCYVITHKGRYCFNASVRGNGKTVTGLDAPAAISASGARLVWQSAKGMITAVSYDKENSQVVFDAARVNGNALIAATDAAGTILWSWHIWFPEEEVLGMPSDTGYEIMNMNLGALHNRSNNIGSYGLLYQWGRKDPFPGSPIMANGSLFTKNAEVYDINGDTFEIEASSMYDLNSNTLAYSIAHPYVCISNNSQFSDCRDWLTRAESNNSLWGNPEGGKRSGGKYANTGSKTYYDPCPAGWRIPNIAVFQNLTSTGGMIWMSEGKWYELSGEAVLNAHDLSGDGKIDLSDYDNGWFFNIDKAAGTYSFFPATTRYDGQYALLMGSMVGLWGNYWYNCPSIDDEGAADRRLGMGFSFGIAEYDKRESITASAISSGSRADAYAVRCVKE